MYTSDAPNSYLASPSRVSISEVLLSYIFCDNTYNAPSSYWTSPSLVYNGCSKLISWWISLSVVTLTLVAHRLPMKPGSH